jgi:hypothetical protein
MRVAFEVIGKAVYHWATIFEVSREGMCHWSEDCPELPYGDRYAFLRGRLACLHVYVCSEEA